MLSLLYHLVQIFQPVLVPLCFLVAWVFIALLGWTLLSAVRDAIARAKTMHEVPCTNCQFFTNSHHLKCTVRPAIANTEQAINCTDYFAKERPFATVTEDFS
ncbi:MAG: hypothetical protein ACFB4I_24215 [Cyanophyceae cyanobacterium]